jgi:hypothetical protein
MSRIPSQLKDKSESNHADLARFSIAVQKNRELNHC